MPAPATEGVRGIKRFVRLLSVCPISDSWTEAASRRTVDRPQLFDVLIDRQDNWWRPIICDQFVARQSVTQIDCFYRSYWRTWQYTRYI